MSVLIGSEDEPVVIEVFIEVADIPLTGSGTGVQFADTYADAAAKSAQVGFVRVQFDEEYGGNQTSMYLFLPNSTVENPLLEFQYAIKTW